MNREESVALWKRCEIVRTSALNAGASEDDAAETAAVIWNTWAQELLERQAHLKRTSQWAAEYITSVDPWTANKWYAYREVGTNEPTIEWLRQARADFSELRFTPKDLNAPARLVQEESTRELQVVDVAQLINFSGFIFPSVVDFFSSEFLADVSFRATTFRSTAGFRYTTFANFVSFSRSEFLGAAWFARMSFKEVALFSMANFRNLARFATVTFEDDALFQSTEFHDKAYFFQNNFVRRADFKEAVFKDDVYFQASKSESHFSLSGASFKKLPGFNQTSFQQAPDLDDVYFPRPPFWKIGDRRLVAGYRAMRRLAIQGHDYDREQMAFVGELRSRRWTTDRWYQPALWLGYIYDAVSDSGRSIARPFITWLVSIVIFGLVYWQMSGRIKNCSAAPDHPLIQAMLLSLKNALVGLSTSRDPRFLAAYDCLYGPPNTQAPIPISVTIIEMVAQIPASASLIFLFLLGVRNRFKIK